MSAIMINHIKKTFFDGTHRVKSPEETYNLVKPLMESIGVSEIVDITSLDRIGIPVFCALRPRAAVGANSVHAGKGREPLYAEISAMMEAIERASAEYRGDAMEYACYEELGLTKAVDPRDLILPSDRAVEIGEKLHWTKSWDILNEEEIYIPSNSIFHPYNSMGMAQPLFRSETNGLASGNVMEEAILHAILEIVERDALSVAEENGSMGHRLTIEHECPARDILDNFEEKGIEIHLWYLPGKTNLPTIAAAADDTVTKDPAMLVVGSGTHTCPEIAALRALTEVAQSRASYLYAGRDDEFRNMVLHKAGYDRLKRINKIWFKPAESVDLKDIPDISTNYIDGDIEVSLNEISAHADRVCVCDLSRTTVPVVRVVIPGLEVSYVDKDRKKSRDIYD
jgi:ribosomal protein S12 methylthiotransferase accessory factor